MITLRLGSKSLAWAVALIAPVVVAYVLYWMPVWVRGQSSDAEYSAWEGLVLSVWGSAGVLASVLAVAIFGRKRKDYSPHV